MQHISNKEPDVHGPALRLCGNLCYGRDAHVERLIASGLLDELSKHLQGFYAKETKEAAWAASNVTAGSPKEIDAVLQHGLHKSLIKLLMHEQVDVKKEACVALGNIFA